MSLRSVPVLESVNAAIDEGFNRTAERSYRSYWDIVDSEFFVMSNLPAGLAWHTADVGYAGFVVKSVRATMGPLVTLPDDAPSLADPARRAPGSGTDGVRQWNLDLAYGPFTDLLGSLDGNPLNKPATIQVNSERTKKPITADINGDPVLNTAGDPPDPGFEADTVANTLVIERNEQAIDLGRNDPKNGWVDHINEDQYGPFAPRTLKIAPVVVDQDHHQTCGVYYRYRFNLEINPDTWDLKFRSQGFRELDPNSTAASPPLRTILIEGVPADDPVPLDKDGHALQPPINKDDLVDVTARIYNTLSFADAFGPFARLQPSGGGTG